MVQKIVVIVVSPAGSVTIDNRGADKRVYVCPAVECKVKDIVGVADAFVGAFVAGLMYKKPIAHALVWGLCTAAYCSQVINR